jgi:hypothetical protein
VIAAHVSRRYARALLELGEGEGNLEALVADVSKMAEMYETSQDLRASVDNPIVPLPTKKAILGELCDETTVILPPYGVMVFERESSSPTTRTRASPMSRPLFSACREKSKRDKRPTQSGSRSMAMIPRTRGPSSAGPSRARP